MQLNTSLSARMEQRQIIAPRMIQSMEILQLPVMALQERIEHELQENPVLELREAGREDENADGQPSDETATDPQVDGKAEASEQTEELVIDDKGSNEEDFDRLD